MNIIPATARAPAVERSDTRNELPPASATEKVARQVARVLRVAVMGDLWVLMSPSASPRIVAAFQHPAADRFSRPRRGDSVDAEIARRLLDHELIEVDPARCRRVDSGELLDLNTVRITAAGWRWLSRHSALASADGLGRMTAGEFPAAGARRWRWPSWRGVRGR